MARKGLGKGLDAFFSHNEAVLENVNTAQSGEVVSELKISMVEPDKNQPRDAFDEAKLAELAASIKEHGVITPIIVTKSGNGFYRIIAGERRWRASKLAGKTTIPAIVRDAENSELYAISLIENLQREDLNPIEEAKGYKRLMSEFSMTQEQIAQKLGKSRSSIANSVRILSLPERVIGFIEKKELSFGHAKVLVACDNSEKQIDLAEKCVKEQLSVRQLEEYISNSPKPEKSGKKKKQDLNTVLAFKALQDKVTERLSTKVKISGSKNKGKIEIEYYGLEDLERIVKLLEV